MASRLDNFNRADSALSLGTPSDGGSAWVAAAGTWGILTNQGKNISGGTNDIAYLESSASDVDIQVIGIGGATSACRLIARYADANNYLLFRTKAGGWDAFKNVAGSFTSILDVAGTPVDGDTLKMSLSGSTLRCYVNGVQKGTDVTVSDGQTNTKHGIASAGTYDDFSITDTGGGGGGGTSAPVSSIHTRARARASTY